MNNTFQDDIFIQSQDYLFRGEEPSFLDLADIFDRQFNEPLQHFNFIEDSAPLFQSGFHQDQLLHRPDNRDDTSLGQLEHSSNLPAKVTFKSSYNKNVCFNICQKTVKVIKKGLYEGKLIQLCQQFEVKIETFKKQILRKKKDFTGPKALGAYIDEKSQESKIFGSFMKWFLTEKYLRFAVNEGEMKDIKAYIEYKNQIILPLLE